MISLIGAVFLVVVFVLAIKVFRLAEKSKEAINVAKHSLEELKNPELDDKAKEVAMQGYAKKLFMLFFLLTLGGGAAVAIPVGLILLMDRIGVL